jgi:hypothetical protein
MDDDNASAALIASARTKVVDVFNLYTKGTIEERVLDVLERRINIFEQNRCGASTPILGEHGAQHYQGIALEWRSPRGGPGTIRTAQLERQNH